MTKISSIHREILIEEKVSDSETMRRENRRIAAMSWSNQDDDIAPPKPSRTPMSDSSSKLFQYQNEMLNNPTGNSDATMTYLVAQNPEILARLMEENQRRGNRGDAASYTPVSVFNVLSVEYDENGAQVDTENKQQTEDMKMTMKKIPATELLLLQKDNTADMFEKCPPQKGSPSLTPSNSINSGDVTDVGYLPMAAAAQKPPQPPDSKTKSLERNMSANATTPANYQQRISSLERARQQQKLAADYAKTRSQSLVRQFSPGIQHEQTMIRSSSLERNQQVPISFKAPYSASFDRFQSPLPPPYVRPPMKSGSLERSQAIIMNDMMRKYYDQKSVNESLKPRSGGSLERNVQYQQYLHMQKQQLEQQLQATQQFQSLQQQQPASSQESIEENIYDFGGVHVKSCASIALKKSIERGMLPPNLAIRPTNSFDAPASGPTSLESIHPMQNVAMQPPQAQANFKQPAPSIANRIMIFQQQQLQSPQTTPPTNVTSPVPPHPTFQSPIVNQNFYNPPQQPESLINIPHPTEPPQVRANFNLD